MLVETFPGSSKEKLNSIYILLSKDCMDVQFEQYLMFEFQNLAKLLKLTHHNMI